MDVERNALITATISSFMRPTSSEMASATPPPFSNCAWCSLLRLQSGRRQSMPRRSGSEPMNAPLPPRAMPLSRVRPISQRRQRLRFGQQFKDHLRVMSLGGQTDRDPRGLSMLSAVTPWRLRGPWRGTWRHHQRRLAQRATRRIRAIASIREIRR